MDKVRVRFAPSPTGFLHVGGLRTALYNYLFAKKNNGSFILRIEDTDKNRFVEGALESLVDMLDSMGLIHDEGTFTNHEIQTIYADKARINPAEATVSKNYPSLVEIGEYGPYIQSERLPLYKKYAKKLVESGAGYYCFCSTGRLAMLREEQIENKLPAKYDKYCLSLSPEEIQERLKVRAPHVIRLNISDERGDIVFGDLVRGQVTIHARDIDDQVLMKSDGYPTYHLANVVDDHLMEITHVIRGEEWLPSTPKHILLYEAFGWKAPAFAHLPLLLNPDKSKLSKRQGDVAVEEYLKKGYLKEALLNFIALLGWNPGAGNTQEIFSLAELVQTFDLRNVHKAGAVFDLKKLDWMNAEYIKKLSPNELYQRVKSGNFLEKDLIKEASQEMQTEEYLKRVLLIERDRLTKLSDVGDNNPFFFASDLMYHATLLNWKENTKEMTQEALQKAHKILSELSNADWVSKETVEKVLMRAAGHPAHSQDGGAAGRSRGDFLWPLRVALTGVQHSPSPFEVAWVLGKEESLKRLEKALKKLS